MANLSKGFTDLALKLQEAASGLGNRDVCSRLGDACNDVGKDNGGYAYYVDHIGDGDSGDVIYSHNGDLKRAPYSMSTTNGKQVVAVDHSQAVDVMPRTTYEDEADEDDHYASMEAAKLYLPGETRFAERAISKAERDAADAGSFAGKGKSYPILKDEDIDAAVHAIGRAGSGNYGPAQLKANIIRIAKAKGWTAKLPKSWQSGGGDTAEAAAIDITGDIIPLREGAVGQDGTVSLKLISPGWGSCGYYSKEMLARDGSKAFPAGTKNFWDHATDAEEASRPEGSLRNLASVLTENAHYEDAGAAGSGLYARAKVFEEFRQPVDDLAKHIGMSIRATAKVKQGKAEGRTGPLIEELSKGISVDYVTTPGAGGQILQLFEAARGARNSQNQGDHMNDEERCQLRETQSENRKLKERFAILDATPAIAEYFTTVRVGEAIQQRVTARILAGQVPLIKESGDLDKPALLKIVEAETKDEVAYVNKLSGGRIVVGMGASQSAELSEAQKAERVAAAKEEGNRFASLFVSTKKGRKIMREGRAAFDPLYNSGAGGLLTSGAKAED